MINKVNYLAELDLSSISSVTATAVFESGKDSAGFPDYCFEATGSLRSPPSANSVKKQSDLLSAMLFELLI